MALNAPNGRTQVFSKAKAGVLVAAGIAFSVNIPLVPPEMLYFELLPMVGRKTTPPALMAVVKVTAPAGCA